jgi:hypothetical protein
MPRAKSKATSTCTKDGKKETQRMRHYAKEMSTETSLAMIKELTTIMQTYDKVFIIRLCEGTYTHACIHP